MRLGTLGAFFPDRLTGRFIANASTASRASLMNLGLLQRDENLCRIFGVPIEGGLNFTFGTGAFALAVTSDTFHRQADEGLSPIVAWQKSGETPVKALDGGVFTASAALNRAKALGLLSDLSRQGHRVNPLICAF